MCDLYSRRKVVAWRDSHGQIQQLFRSGTIFLVLIVQPSIKVLAAHVGLNWIQKITFNTVSKGNSVFTPGCGDRDDPTCEGVSACNSEKDATLPGKQRDRVHPIPPHQVPLSDGSL